MKHGFDAPVLVCIDEGGASVSLAAERTYTGSHGDSWVIPEGFRTDFATIPSILSWAVMKMGLWTLAAIVHDLLCEGLNKWHRAWPISTGSTIHVDSQRRRFLVLNGEVIPEPTANAVDTDAIFYKIAREYGTDIVTANLLWVGVRLGALANPARREGWLRTAPRVIGSGLLFAIPFLIATPFVLVGRGLLALARIVVRLIRR